METLLSFFIVLGVYTFLKNVIWLYLTLFGNRDGNSGRYKHWGNDYEV